MRNNGLTLIELLVVIVIIAILAGLVYLRSRDIVHRERYAKAFSLLQIVAEAKREQMVRAPEVMVQDQIRNTHNNVNPDTCINYDVPTTRDPGYLIACGYLQPENWESEHHRIYLCHEGQGGQCCSSGPDGTIACAVFINTDGTEWNYYISRAGDCRASPGAIPCLEF